MTIFSGLFQLLIGRLIHLLRPYLPTEIAGFAMLMSGLTLGIIGFNLITGVSVASAVMSTSMQPGAALGLACLLVMIGLYVWGADGIRLFAQDLTKLRELVSKRIEASAAVPAELP